MESESSFKNSSTTGTPVTSFFRNSLPGIGAVCSQNSMTGGVEQTNCSLNECNHDNTLVTGDNTLEYKRARLLTPRLSMSSPKNQRTVRRECPHCKREVGLKTFKRHKKLYLKSDGSWIKEWDRDHLPGVNATAETGNYYYYYWCCCC